MSPPPRERLQRIARSAMIERGLEPDFPAAAMSEAERASPAPVQSPSASVRDLRSLLWCSIDNDDSRYLARLTGSEAPGASTVIRVAVADVAAVVAQNSSIDRHASQNTTSVYTEAEIFPMLPLLLSTDRTSLNPNEDRLAVVVEAEVNQAGSVTRGDVYAAAVRNHAKLAYP